MKRLIQTCGILLFGMSLIAGCGDQAQDEERTSTAPSRAPAKIADAATRRAKPQKPETNGVLRAGGRSGTNRVVRVVRPALPEADQKLMDAIDAASDGESKDKLVALDAQIRSAKNPDVREAYVEALSAYGQQALAALSAYLTDPNEDVARTAMCRFESALAEVDDETIKVAAIESVFMTVGNAESLEFLAGTLNAADEKLAVEAIVRIVDSGNRAGAKVAKESYEVVTGEPYTDAKAATAWLKENYTPPDAE